MELEVDWKKHANEMADILAALESQLAAALARAEEAERGKEKAKEVALLTSELRQAEETTR